MATYKGQLKDSLGNTLVTDGFYPGDSIDMFAIVSIGYTTSGATQLYFQIPLNKPVYATGFNVQYLHLQMRTSNCEYPHDGTTAIPATGIEVPLSSIKNVTISPYTGIRIRYDATTRWNNNNGTQFNNGLMALTVTIRGTFT